MNLLLQCRFTSTETLTTGVNLLLPVSLYLHRDPNDWSDSPPSVSLYLHRDPNDWSESPPSVSLYLHRDPNDWSESPPSVSLYLHRDPNDWRGQGARDCRDLHFDTAPELCDVVVGRFYHSNPSVNKNNDDNNSVRVQTAASLTGTITSRSGRT